MVTDKERFVSMSPDQFSSLDRSALTENAQAAYDRVAPRRQTPDWLARLAQREQEVLHRREIKRLYHLSRTISAIAFLLVLGLVLLIAIFFAYRAILAQLLGIAETPLLMPFLLIVTFYVTALVGIIRRPRWGWDMGQLMCGLYLFLFPIGTIIGIVGLVAFARGRDLFGPDRPKYADLRKELGSE